MTIQSGSILISAPSLDDPNFEKGVIFITEYNKNGALGFVVNKPFERKLNELVEFKHCAPFPLYAGGPVDKEKIYFIHQRPDLIEQGITVTESIYIGGNFKQAVQHINNKSLEENGIKLFIGYCGWDYLQLEEEIEEGSWLLIDAPVHTVFKTHTALLWEELYKSKGQQLK